MSLTKTTLNVEDVSCTAMNLNNVSLNNIITINDLSDCLYSNDSGITFQIIETTSTFTIECSGGSQVTSDDLDLIADPNGSMSVSEDTVDKIWNLSPAPNIDFRYVGHGYLGQVEIADNTHIPLTLKGVSGRDTCSGILFNTAGQSVGMICKRNGDTPQFAFISFQNDSNSGKWEDNYYNSSTTGIVGSFLNYANNSDIRLKTNIKPLHNALKIINKLNIVQYDKYDSFKRDPISTFNKCVGVIAQEVDELNDPILSYSVSQPDEITPYSIDYEQLFNISMKALQELHKEYKEYKEFVSKKIELLEKRLNVLENN